MKTFYLLWRSNGGAVVDANGDARKYDERERADADAVSAARTSPGEQFFVLESVAVACAIGSEPVLESIYPYEIVDTPVEIER